MIEIFSYMCEIKHYFQRENKINDVLEPYEIALFMENNFPWNR